ncbi:hypothetical protein FRC07_007885 [Ceratobasidium sp. 392]|nr:hypothetical protein FRC07_007885 [Ceratobasidium sp. 392]
MFEVNKKRRLDDEEGFSWSKRKAAAFVNEVGELQTNLRSCHASTLVEGLVDSLEDCQPEAIRMFKDFISPVLKANTEPRHCVRCHETYTEVENRNDSCVVICGPSAVKTAFYEEAKYRMVKTRCCGRMRRENVTSESETICYRVRHTANVGNVKYFKDPNRKNPEEGLKYNGYNPTVVPCSVFAICGEDLDADDDEESEGDES